MSQEKIGKVIVDTYAKKQHEMQLGEMIDSQLDRYFNVLVSKVAEGKKKFSGKDFYIEMLLKKEKLMPQILPRIFGMSRLSCPTPNHDQGVYYYSFRHDRLDLIWSVPDPYACFDITSRYPNIEPSEHDLLKYVQDFQDGTLFKVMKKLNGEAADSPLLIS